VAGTVSIGMNEDRRQDISFRDDRTPPTVAGNENNVHEFTSENA